MATQTIITITDDLDQTSEADKTVTFGLEGKTWEIDLSSAHIDELNDALAVYIEHGRPVTSTKVRPTTGRATKADREQTQAIREWGRANGYTVSDRGRIPATLLEAYNAAV